MTEYVTFDDYYEKDLSLNLKPIFPGAIVSGRITDINRNFITVNAFLKSDGYVPTSQFINEDGKIEVQIGNEVELVIDYLEDYSGDVKLSRDKAKRIRAWEKLENVYKSNDIIVGYVTSKVKGGFTVKLDVIKAFLPGSLISFKSDVQSDDFKGKKMKFKIIKLEKKKNNIVVSQKFTSEDKSNRNFQHSLTSINEGDVVSGLVKNITDYGVFVDLGGIDGLLHITDMAWKRVKHPSNIVKIGETIKVKILKFDKISNRVSLGLKQLIDDPWKNVKEKYKEGDIVNGKVTNITDYGCFVEIEEGIEGLVHSSEMNWTNKNINPNKIVKYGMDIKVSILDINQKKRRMSLGIKQNITNPWILFYDKYKNGDKIYGKIKSITDFGLFLELEYGIDGLIHLFDITWENQNDSILRTFKKGDEIKAVILSIDIERERIFLSLKNFLSESFFNYISKFSRSDFINCKIIKKIEKNYNVKLTNKLDGILKLDEKNKLNKKMINTHVKAKIEYIDKKNKNIILIYRSVSDIDKKN